jgi:alkylation response protein AidB-like acyl-CoA dehydrogenase
MDSSPVERGVSEGVLEAARRLAPQIAAASDQIEEQRRLAPEVVEALVDAGLFRMLVPRSLGGAETELLTFARVIETIAQADASTAWCLCQASGTSMVSAYLPPASARAIFGRTETILAWGPGPGGTAQVVDGGFRLSGQWSFASGCRHATWLAGRGPVLGEDGRPRIDADGAPEMRMFLFPAEQAEIVDVWQVNALRGTASDTYRVADVFIPEEHTLVMPLRNPHEPGPLYRFVGGGTFNLVFASGFSSVALGVARAALDAFCELARTKSPRGLRGVLREQALVQSQVGQAEATVQSARALLHETVTSVWEAVSCSGALTTEQRVLVRLATVHAIQSSVQAVDTVYHAAGSTAIFASSPFDRRFRDVHAVAQHLQGRMEHYETAGQYFLGLDPDPEWL